ncbi:CPBP family intramembrane metalloprotease [Gordonia sp. TBRC 11910]|uniref:CPBP family intramembrane metalloprotease n=1 Tax=Gordonia asplenii TaxID=2725283 RepID=A0A848L9W3_9ACTN|nr:CPBP family intramembrane metalloprotease [Gordonia asplenii]
MLRALLVPPPQTTVDVVRDPTQRRGLVIELVIVGILTFGFSAVYAILSLIEAQLGAGIAHTTVALNPTRSTNGAIDFTRQVMSAIRLGAIASLGIYLLWRSGIRLNRVGLARRPAGADVPPGLILAAVIGLPGIGLLALSRLLGINAQLIASPTDGPWWQLPVLILIAIGNAVAEEVVVVAYFITRLRQLGAGENSALAASAVLRGGYHLYQGVGAGVGNLLMGLIFGRYFQRTDRTWPLVIAHATIDVVAFVGYALLADHLGFLK